MHFIVVAVVVAVVSCSEEGLEGDDANKHADVAVLVAAADEARKLSRDPKPALSAGPKVRTSMLSSCNFLWW